jgi:hypothetical protein
MSYNFKSGFPQSWPSGQFENKIIDQFLKKNKFDLVVNTTWSEVKFANTVFALENKLQLLDKVITNEKNLKCLFYNFVDPLYGNNTYTIIKKAIDKFGGHNVCCIGYFDANVVKVKHISFWALMCEQYFKKYTTEQLIPQNLEKLFLCYNRKPADHRKKFIEKCTTEKIVEKGCISLGNFDDPTKAITVQNTATHTIRDSGVSGSVGIPNDTMSLGPLDIWNKCLFIIVTETSHMIDVGSPFTSEKIWKPIIGLRPFVCLGDNNTHKYLRDNGFHTFNDLLNINDNPSAEDIVNGLKKFKQEYNSFYQSLKGKLIHNRKRFFEFCKEEQKKI